VNLVISVIFIRAEEFDFLTTEAKIHYTTLLRGRMISCIEVFHGRKGGGSGGRRSD